MGVNICWSLIPKKPHPDSVQTTNYLCNKVSLPSASPVLRCTALRNTVLAVNLQQVNLFQR